MARIRCRHALDDQRRGSFNFSIVDCICGSWTASDPQYVQPRVQAQGANINEFDGDIDRAEILYGAHQRPHQTRVRAEDKYKVQEDETNKRMKIYNSKFLILE